MRLAALVALFALSCATPRVPVVNCDASPKHVKGFLGVQLLPDDIDPARSVYCGCAVDCGGEGPSMTYADFAVCISPPEECASRAIFCENPEEAGALL